MDDKLDEMWFAQRLLAKEFIPVEQANGEPTPSFEVWGDLNDRGVQRHLRSVIMDCVEELVEAHRKLGFKPHKQSKTTPDVEGFKEEVSDAWHFFLEFLILAGIDPEELYHLYFAKNSVNHQRILGGY